MSNQKRNPKKILVVDDSALMRRTFCDIIDSDERFEVADCATNGMDALELLKTKSYDAVLLDIIMPRMGGLEMLRELRRLNIAAKVMVVSAYAADGADVTMEALSLGAMDFVAKPENVSESGIESFREKMLRILDAVVHSHIPVSETPAVGVKWPVAGSDKGKNNAQSVGGLAGDKIVAIATSTGGPKALQAVIPQLPEKLDAPVLLVQHMPKGFTESLAERLNVLSSIRVKEAKEGEELRKGTVYIAMGGLHMTIRRANGGKYAIHYLDEPPREGVKPSANYMFESLSDSDFRQIVCVVMTGMGADGTAGIRALKMKKEICVITQDAETSTVYGMPKNVVKAGLADREAPLSQIAQEIAKCVGVQNT